MNTLNIIADGKINNREDPDEIASLDIKAFVLAGKG
jgi:hypothetical protein